MQHGEPGRCAHRVAAKVRPALRGPLDRSLACTRRRLWKLLHVARRLYRCTRRCEQGLRRWLCAFEVGFGARCELLRCLQTGERTVEDKTAM
jgi:hypothetical protein